MSFNVSAAAKECDKAYDYISLVSGGVSTKDARIFDYDSSNQYWSDFLVNANKSAEFYSALHASKFNPVSQTVIDTFTNDIMVDYSSYYDYLIFNRFPMILVAGEYDSRNGAKVIQTWMKTMLTKLRDSFWEKEQLIYHYTENKAKGVGGYYKQQDLFTYITLPKAGGDNTQDNYNATTAVLADFIQFDRLKCRGCSTVSPKCLAMLYCNNNGTNSNGVCNAENGVCKCNPGFKGADCSYNNTNLQQDPHKLVLTKGNKFVYFTVPYFTQAWSLSIKSSARDFTVYLKDG